MGSTIAPSCVPVPPHSTSALPPPSHAPVACGCAASCGAARGSRRARASKLSPTARASSPSSSPLLGLLTSGACPCVAKGRCGGICGPCAPASGLAAGGRRGGGRRAGRLGAANGCWSAGGGSPSASTASQARCVAAARLCSGCRGCGCTAAARRGRSGAGCCGCWGCKTCGGEDCACNSRPGFCVLRGCKGGGARSNGCCSTLPPLACPATPHSSSVCSAPPPQLLRGRSRL